MCDEAATDSITALKLIPDWFVISRMIKTRFIDFYAYENVFYFNYDSDTVVFICNEMGILNIDLNSINYDDKFDEYYPFGLAY